VTGTVKLVIGLAVVGVGGLIAWRLLAGKPDPFAAQLALQQQQAQLAQQQAALFAQGAQNRATGGQGPYVGPGRTSAQDAADVIKALAEFGSTAAKTIRAFQA
jgi:hypothetical protein